MINESENKIYHRASQVAPLLCNFDIYEHD